MSQIQKELLVKALENENNSSIIDLNHQIIMDEKNNILQKLQLEREKLKNLHKKLKPYRYISNLNHIVIGNYIRWINIKDPEIIKLTNGAIICDIEKKDDNIYIMCKNNYNRFFKINCDYNLIFQKINSQENIILSVLNYLNK
jgi:hypothetical protein